MSWKRTIRFRLTMAFLAVILVANVVISLVAVLQIGQQALAEVQTRVRLDLNSAWQVYNNHIEHIERFLFGVSLSRALAETDPAATDLAERMTHLQSAGRVDILSLLDGTGRVLLDTGRSGIAGDELAADPLVRRVLHEGQPVSGTVILPASLLAHAGSSLAEAARIEVQPTPAARPGSTRFLGDGMALAVAMPVRDRNGRLVRVLYGANLLNRRFHIVDAIKDEVFQNQTWVDKDIGTATIFQDDLRISTNVRTATGERAIGTRLSAAVYGEVIERGNVWADRAFVVNDWYITAYAPIRDPSDRIIGALYVGLLEEPFAQPQRLRLLTLLAIMAATTIVSLLLLFFVTKLTLRPIGRVVFMSQRVVAGDLTARVGIRPSGEMGQLCQAVDQMAEAVLQRERALEQATRQQIGQSEKLASIGRLAAGIAHEINNPLTGVLTFAHLMHDKQNMEPQDIEDLQVIIKETTRVREIVRGLLDFARESPSRMQLLDVGEVLHQTMKLLRSQKAFGKITIEEQGAPDLPQVCADKNQLQQVFLNLALNACEAMPQGGSLVITTAVRGDSVTAAFQDTGCGIQSEHLAHIFEPFFTTKPVGKGTGLGLSVSYGILQQHRGALEVESQAGVGTTFTVVLPICSDGVCQSPTGRIEP